MEAHHLLWAYLSVWLIQDIGASDLQFASASAAASAVRMGRMRTAVYCCGVSCCQPAPGDSVEFVVLLVAPFAMANPTTADSCSHSRPIAISDLCL